MAVCVFIQLILVQTGSVFGSLGAGDAVMGADWLLWFGFGELLVISLDVVRE